jgi:hypothetical protein
MSLLGIIGAFLLMLVGTAASGGDLSNSSNTPADVKEIVHAIESCAAGNVDGSYAGCLDSPELRALTQEIRSDYGLIRIRPLGTDVVGYEVTIQEDDTRFVERHEVDGSIVRTCEPDEEPDCNDGTW